MIYPQGHFGTACVLLGALLVGCDDAPVGPPELRDAGIGHPPEEADAGFEPDAGVEVDAGPPPFDLGAHQKNHRCCDCLARALVPGGPCAAHGDCGVGMKCFCLDEDCTATQCGATADLGPEAAINAECRCANGDCSRLVCGVKCLIGEEDSCVEALDESTRGEHRGAGSSSVGLGGLVRIGSLFSGIGGLDLGLEAGLGGETVFQVEIEPYPHKVLKRRFPEAQQFRDVCEVGAHNLPAVDVLCGGPPCQSWSLAGKQKGFDDARGQLSLEYLRIVGELLPRFCVIENVSGYKKAMPDIIRGLTEHGYSVQWDVIPAAAVGAPHRRDRFFIVGMRDAGLFLDFHAVLPKRPSWPALDVEPTRPRTRGKRVKGDVARLKALGNAVVPDCAEVVGLAISGAYTYDFPADMRSWDSVDDMPPSAVPRAGYVSAVEGTVWALASATKAGGKRLLSTPAAHDPKDTGAPSEMLRKSPTLGALAFAGKLPTPTTFDRVGERRGSAPYVTETGTMRSRRADGSSSNLGLAGMASVGSLPTPKTQDRWDRTDSEAEAARNTPSLSYQMGGPLNPEFVEWMMGFERGWTALED